MTRKAKYHAIMNIVFASVEETRKSFTVLSKEEKETYCFVFFFKQDDRTTTKTNSETIPGNK